MTQVELLAESLDNIVRIFIFIDFYLLDIFAVKFNIQNTNRLICSVVGFSSVVAGVGCLRRWIRMSWLVSWVSSLAQWCYRSSSCCWRAVGAAWGSVGEPRRLGSCRWDITGLSRSSTGPWSLPSLGPPWWFVLPLWCCVLMRFFVYIMRFWWSLIVLLGRWLISTMLALSIVRRDLWLFILVLVDLCRCINFSSSLIWWVVVLVSACLVAPCFELNIRIVFSLQIEISEKLMTMITLIMRKRESFTSDQTLDGVQLVHYYEILILMLEIYWTYVRLE